jgi:hypothetical protein
MHKGVIGMVARYWRRVVALLIAASLPSVDHALAADVGGLLPGGLSYKKYHVSYDVKADGTYTELDEVALGVLTKQGAQASAAVTVIPNGFALGKQDVEVVAAYTLKANGERVDAVRTNPLASGGRLSSGAASAPNPAALQFTSVAFQLVDVGDTLVLSFKSTQEAPAIPNSIVLNKFFPDLMAYEDALISLSAPSSLSLRVDASGFEGGQRTTAGEIQQWQWTYQNKSPVAFQPNRPVRGASVHVSTFKDTAAEKAAFATLRKAMPTAAPVATRRCADVPNSSNFYSSYVRGLFWMDGGQLKRLVEEWNDPKCVSKDGQPTLMALSAGYASAIKGERDWSRTYARIQELKKQFPDEAFVALAEASYWSSYAWNARGHGYSDSVSEEGWQLFRQRLEKAEDILTLTKSYSANLPPWYRDMIEVEGALGRPEEARAKIFLEGVRRYPSYYPIYFTMLNFLLPKWGGSWETVDKMVEWSVEHTKEVEGNSMYARLYWVVAGDPQVRLFKDTMASWPKMKLGFEDLMARHPQSKWNLNNFARFACMAGDGETFSALRRKIGKDVSGDAWTGNTPLELCEEKFHYKE